MNAISVLWPYVGISHDAKFREAENNTLTNTDLNQGIKHHYTDGVRTTLFQNTFLLWIMKFSLLALMNTFPSLAFWLDPSLTLP